jgi:hypothetical protein
VAAAARILVFFTCFACSSHVVHAQSRDRILACNV